ncbi:MAG: DUF4339 domain-containing protein, partial [Gluconacetobacter diazotrophicus]|nr:DUF4339 domain-containing protein [Gluconacetobacter diazotrophicus]
QEAVSREEAGTYLVLPDADAEADTLLRTEPGEIERWAAEIFDGGGGSRALFPVLEDEGERAALLNRLRGVALRELGPRAARLRSIHDILLGMAPAERQRVWEKAMVRAMPWLNAGFDHLGESMVMADRYKLLVAVEDRGRFAADFGRELAQAVPTGRLGLHGFDVVNSGLRNRIILYCEVSGIPLDSIAPLRDDWRNSYRGELSAAFPLHNHRQVSRFPSPVVPNAAEIEDTRAVVGLFLRAACFDLIRRGEGAEAPWQLHVGGGDWIDIGTERDLRNNGFASANHRALVRERVERFERELVSVQVLAAAVLLDWTARHAYAARKLRIGPNQTDRVPGLTHKVALELADGYARRFNGLPDAHGLGDAAAARTALAARIGDWTRPVPGSVADVDPGEANRDPDEREGALAEDKRRIVPERFAPAALRNMLAAARPAAAVVDALGETERRTGGRSWYLGTGGVASGPFELDRLAEKRAELKPGSNVLELGTRHWVRLREVPELMALIDAPPPPPPEEERGVPPPPPPDDED